MKVFVIVLVAFLFSSCGSVKVSPRSCNTNAVWGSSFDQLRHLDGRVISQKSIEINKDKTYFVPFNKNINIREILENYQYNCVELDKLRVEVRSYAFFWKKIILHIEIK